MRKMSGQKPNNVRFCNHTSQLPALREQHMSQVLGVSYVNTRGKQWLDLAYHLLKHIHNQLQRNFFPQLQYGFLEQ